MNVWLTNFWRGWQTALHALNAGRQAIGFVSTRRRPSSYRLGRLDVGSSAQWTPWLCPAPSSACAFSISVSCDSSVVHSRWILHCGPCVHTQQAGLLQRPVRWLSCRSADAVAVCPKCSRSCTRAARPCFSLSSHAQLVTLAELSTASHVQVVLALYIQLPARPGACQSL